jgi:hypothetical protein
MQGRGNGFQTSAFKRKNVKLNPIDSQDSRIDLVRGEEHMSWEQELILIFQA